MTRLSVLALILAACGNAEASFHAPPLAPTTTPTVPPQFERPAPAGPWYTLTLPEGATRAAVPSEEIDSVIVLDAAERLQLTIVRPMPGQSDVDGWTTSVGAIFADDVVEHLDPTTIDGVPARLAVCPGQLRWTLVADGYGVVVQCFSETLHDEAWLRAHCDPIVESLRLVRPLHD